MLYLTNLHNKNTLHFLSFLNIKSFFLKNQQSCNRPFYVKTFPVFLFSLGMFIAPISAQEIPNEPQQGDVKLQIPPNGAPQGSRTTPPIAKEDNSTTFIQEISKTASSYPKPFKVKKSTLSRKYYNNNIFDISESDNPFALPIGGGKSKRITPNKDAQNNQVAIFELFNLSDQTNRATTIAKWLIFVLLGILSFMTIILAIYPKEVSTIFQSFLSTSTSSNGQREQAIFFKIESFSTYFLFILGMGTFCFLIPQILTKEVHFNTFGALLLSIFGIIGIYFLKHSQLKILSFILPFRQEIEAYNSIVSNTNKALGFMLVPILFLIAYTPESAQIVMLYSSFILLGLIYIYRTLKGLATAGSIILFHKFHFFVYLCAVEIAPILVLLKLLSIL